MSPDRGLPRGRGIFPIVVGERALSGAVGVHDEQLTIGLGSVIVERGLVFETESRAAEQQIFAVGRPSGMGVVAGSVGQLLEVATVGPDWRKYRRRG